MCMVLYSSNQVSWSFCSRHDREWRGWY